MTAIIKEVKQPDGYANIAVNKEPNNGMIKFFQKTLDLGF